MFSFEASKIKEGEGSQQKELKSRPLISQEYEYEIAEESDNEVLI